MRVKRRRKPRGARTLAVSAAMLIGSAALVGLFYAAPLLSGAIRRAAVISVAVAMPDISLDLFEQRFRAEIYGGELQGVTHESVPFSPEPAPEASPNAPPLDAPPLDAPPQNPLQQPESVVPPVASPAPARPQARIPARYAAPIINENFAGHDGAPWLIRQGDTYIRNETKYADEYVLEILDEPINLQFVLDGRPQVLIVHTHATEAFEKYDCDMYDTRNNWRSTDNNVNMAAVGAVFADVLESYGIGVIHDTTQHDYPSYNGSYTRAAKTIRGYLEDYPSIQIVLDLHRDAMPREDAIVKPVAMINGKKTAQIMIISGSDNGTMNMPNWRDNFRMATEFQNYMEAEGRGLTRPVYLCHRKYNMDLTPGSLLLEIGSNANTIEEAKLAAEFAGHALAALMTENEADTSH